MKTKVAKYLIVSVNDDGEHEIVFVTNNKDELMKRWYAFAGTGAVYTESQMTANVRANNAILTDNRT